MYLKDIAHAIIALFMTVIVTQLLALKSEANSELEIFPSVSTDDNGALNRRLGIDIGIVVPAFLIQIPLSISNEFGFVSGTINIYYQATRTIKVVGAPGKRYRATVSVTTFMFFMEYTSSIYGAQVHKSQDTIYLSRVEAEIWSLDVSGVIAIA
ncbi:hypothetical protein H4R24_004031 [Coemansia sp. RSA 988]|nr:hypothetical protein H4R24_004031 [Coemansia sp. RSA 988]